jgi:4-nitrophenyl phosphatase
MIKFFIDLDGTVYLDGQIIDSVNSELLRISNLGVSIFYMTNNTSVSLDSYVEKIKKLGLPLGENSIISPTMIFVDWIIDKGISKIFSVGSSQFNQDVKNLANVEICEVKPELVIVAFDKELNYDKLQYACELVNQGVPYFLTHIDLACPTNKGPIPDCGSIGKLIELTTGVPHSGHFGKPGESMINFLKKHIESDDEIFVVGDRLYTDAVVGLELNARTILVCSGEFKRSSNLIDRRIEVHDTLSGFIRTQFP